VLWQDAREVCIEIYQITERERFNDFKGLRWQMLDSSGSIMDNIAEGFERGSNKEFRSFLGFSRGSVGELRSQLYRCADIELANPNELQVLSNRLISMSKRLKKLMRSLGQSSNTGFRLSK